MEGYWLIQTNHDHILSEIMDNVCVRDRHILVSPYQEIPCLIQSGKTFHAQSKRNDRLVSQSVALQVSLLPAQRDLFDPWHVGKTQDLLLKS